jgi:hypothetical protein
MFESTAVPVPEPAPVATKVIPVIFANAPNAVKSVVPTNSIVYTVPATYDAAATVAGNTSER